MGCAGFELTRVNPQVRGNWKRWRFAVPDTLPSGRATREWTDGSLDSPKRDLRGWLAIGEIVSRFEVVALGDLRELHVLMKWLGADWAFPITDVNIGAAGNSERMAFI